MIRRVLVGAAVIAALLGAPTAHAEGLTRYWSYWNAPQGTWIYATQGAGTVVPADGTVEGWSFVVTPGMSAEARPPTPAPTDAWTQACGDTTPGTGKKAVAVVIDYGTADIAPAGETPPPPVIACAVVEESANGFHVLSAVTDVRADGGFLCGIAGYPRDECAPIIDALEPTMAPGAAPPAAAPIAEAPAESSGTPWWTLAALALAALVGAILWRRRS